MIGSLLINLFSLSVRLSIIDFNIRSFEQPQTSTNKSVKLSTQHLASVELDE